MSNNTQKNMDIKIENNNSNVSEKMKETLFFINETYDKLSYFDLYGNSVIIFIFVTLFVFIVFSYCKVMQTKEAIADDWVNQRCKPQNMIFAGLITHPEGTSAFQYTSDNFQYCVQNILSNISGYALQPFQFMINALTKVFQEIANALQQSRELINNIRNGFKEFAQNVLSRILNIMIPIQKMFIALMDTFQKIQGTMTAGLYTMLGSNYTLQALMGAILELIIKILIALVIIIVGLWILPFTWPAAASMTVIFLAIAIPLAIIIYFMTEVLHIKSSGIPKLRCFDEYTLIPLQNGNKIHIKDINIGDKLENGSYVTAKIKVTSSGLKMYRLNNIFVSGTHLVKYQNKWIRIEEHPNAELISYNKPFLYCLNTNSKTIIINDICFTDWDEIYNSSLNSIINYLTIKFNKKVFKEDIDDLVFEGFNENDKVLTINGLKEIKNIEVGTLLNENNIVYGIVQNINNYDNKLYYHLLVSDKKFIINNILVNDFNYRIDGILEKLKK